MTLLELENAIDDVRRMLINRGLTREQVDDVEVFGGAVDLGIDGVLPFISIDPYDDDDFPHGVCVIVGVAH